MHIDNQKNSDQRRFSPKQHSKSKESPYANSSTESPKLECRNLENEQKYLFSPGSDGSQNRKQDEANPQDDMQSKKEGPATHFGGSQFDQEKRQPIPCISTQNVLKLEDDQVLQLQSFLKQKVGLFIFLNFLKFRVSHLRKPHCRCE